MKTKFRSIYGENLSPVITSNIPALFPLYTDFPLQTKTYYSGAFIGKISAQLLRVIYLPFFLSILTFLSRPKHIIPENLWGKSQPSCYE